MTYISNPRHYTVAEFQILVDGLTWGKGWRPKFPTHHNTGDPSMRQWIAYGPTVEERWAVSLDRYYKGLGWHSGPHLVVCPDYIWVLCDLEADGVSVSCWNHLTIGIEHVGDFSEGADDPTTGDGARVIANGVAATAILARKLGWDMTHTVVGVSGLHFHRECVQDHHACPGDRVSKPDIAARILAAMKGPAPGQGSSPAPAAPPAAPIPSPAPAPSVWTPAPPGSEAFAWTKWAQSFCNARVPNLTPIAVDGDFGDETRDAISAAFAAAVNFDLER